jgi:hypothetical protein
MAPRFSCLARSTLPKLNISVPFLLLPATSMHIVIWVFCFSAPEMRTLLYCNSIRQQRLVPAIRHLYSILLRFIKKAAGRTSPSSCTSEFSSSAQAIPTPLRQCGLCVQFKLEVSRAIPNLSRLARRPLAVGNSRLSSRLGRLPQGVWTW